MACKPQPGAQPSDYLNRKPPTARRKHIKRSKYNFWNTPSRMELVDEDDRQCRLRRSERRLNEMARRNDPYATRLNMNGKGALTGSQKLINNVAHDIHQYHKQLGQVCALARRTRAQKRKYQLQMDKLANEVADITIAEPEPEELQYPMSDEEWAAYCASSESEHTSDCTTSSEPDSSSESSAPATPREGSVEPTVSIAVQAINDLHVATPEERLVRELNDSILSMDLAPKPQSPPLPSRNRKARQESKPYDRKMRRHARAAEADLPDDTPLPTSGDLAAATAHLQSAVKRAKERIDSAELAAHHLNAMAGVAYTRIYGMPPKPEDVLHEALAPEQVVRKARLIKAQAESAREHAEKMLSRYCLACQYAGVPVSAELVDSAEALITL
ncbi:hypothetical protein K525DRAFT_230485 [Schizophyllum commune Loenen D]|nr:hypothetical protein K525DRAFT_230485 [Schizophyllum commune Loenen D]